jgi:transposase
MVSMMFSLEVNLTPYTDHLTPPSRGLAVGRSGPSTREQQLEAEVAELTQALGEAAVEIRVWKKSAEGHLGPSRTSR